MKIERIVKTIKENAIANPPKGVADVEALHYLEELENNWWGLHKLLLNEGTPSAISASIARMLRMSIEAFVDMYPNENHQHLIDAAISRMVNDIEEGE